MKDLEVEIYETINMGDASSSDIPAYLSQEYWSVNENNEIELATGIVVKMNRASNGWPEITFENGNKLDVAIDDDELPNHFFILED